MQSASRLHNLHIAFNLFAVELASELLSLSHFASLRGYSPIAWPLQSLRPLKIPCIGIPMTLLEMRLMRHMPLIVFGPCRGKRIASGRTSSYSLVDIVSAIDTRLSCLSPSAT